MKKLKTKLFISLGLVATVITACFVAAYTINIGNQESYGTLNLNKLILRNSSGGTGIVLDGTEYVIKIGENAGSDEYSKLRVAYICERNGQHCKTIAQLAQDNDSSNILIIQGSGTSAVSFNQKEDATLNIVGSGNTTVSATDGKIIISSTDNDTRNANTLNVPGYVAAPTGGTSKKVRKTNNSGYPSRQNDADTHYEGVLTIQGSGTQAVQFDQENSPTLNIVGSGNTRVSATTNTITIYSTGGGGGDSLWAESEDKTQISPTDTSDAVVVGNYGIGQSKKYLFFKGSGSHAALGKCGTGYGAQILEFTDQIILHRRGYVCSSNEKQLAINGRGLGIDAAPSETYALNINGDAHINNITASGASIASHHFDSNKVGINMATPFEAALQVNGAIYIQNNGHGSNCTPGTIDFTGGNFYGCVEGSWKRFIIDGSCGCTNS